MRAAAPFVLALAVAGVAGAAEPTAVPVAGRDARTALALTVYAGDLALVRDTREVAIPPGESRLRVEDVAMRIDPRTVMVRSLTDPARLTLAEQTSATAELTPQALLERSVGLEVELVETDARLRTQVTRATLVSATGGAVYRVGDRIVLGHPGQVVLPGLPEGLTARPALLWRLANTGPERHRIEISYLTGGLSWDADYALTLEPDGGRADLTGWATVANESGTRFAGAGVTLVAGQIGRAEPPGRPMYRTMERGIAAAAPAMAPRELFEYHAYALPGPTTLEQAAATRLRLLGAQGMAVRRTLVVTGEAAWVRSPEGDTARELPVRVLVELVNDQPHGLGQPLPAGVVRLYQRDAGGDTALVGEDRIDHTPAGEKMTLEAGTAFDVKATRRQTGFAVVGTKPFEHEVAFAIELRNRKAEPVTVLVREPMGGQWKVIESSHPPVTVDARTLGFTVEVPAKGTTTVTYRAQTGTG